MKIIIVIILLFFSACDFSHHSEKKEHKNHNHKEHDGCSSHKKNDHEHENHNHKEHDGCSSHDHEEDKTTKKTHTLENTDFSSIEDISTLDEFETKQEKHTDEEHNHEEKHCSSKTPHDHKGHEHTSPKQSKAYLEKLQKQTCEHKTLIIECTDCRPSVGVVKLQSGSNTYTNSETVQKSYMKQNLHLLGEVKLNRLKTVTLFPIVSGRITKIVRKLGEKVKKGELLAILHSRDYGKAKLDYISACQQYKIAKENLDWTNTIHRNLKKLIKNLKNIDKANLLQVLQVLEIGKNKERLVRSVAQYRVARANYKREIKKIRNIGKALKLLRKIKSIKNIDRYLNILQIGEWKAKLIETISKLKLSQSSLQREKQLLKRGISSQQKLQEIENEYNAAYGNYHATLETVTFWLKEKKIEIETELEASMAQYQSIVEEIQIDLKLHKLKVIKDFDEARHKKFITEKQLNIMGLTNKEIQSKKFFANASFGILEIRAPISGTIISFNFSEGQFVEVSQWLYTISNLSKVWVECDLYDYHIRALSHIKNKLSLIKARIKVSTSLSRSFQGEVEYISETMNMQSRTVKMRVVVKNDEKLLKPGMFAEVDVTTPVSQKTINVSKEAVYWDENKAFVFKHWKDNFWIRCDVTPGKIVGERYQILAGLKTGDVIISKGGFMLKSEVLKSKMGAG